MMQTDSRRLQRYAVPLAAGCFPFVVYLCTMAPTVYGLDSAELTTGAYVLGIVHSPGAPLFLLLAHAFTWLPIGDVGYRVNLVSVCSGAGAVAVLASLVHRLTDRPLTAVAGGWVLAFSFYYWVSALAAELYAPLALSIAALLWLACVWRERQRPWQLCLFSFLFGLALGNHMSLGAMMPGFAYLLLRDVAWPRWPLIVAATVSGTLGACIYLYLPLRAAAGPPLDFARDYGVDASTWSGFWFMVRGGMFQSWFLAVPLSRLPTEVGLFTYRLWSNFLGLGCLIGFVGIIDVPSSLRPLQRASILMLLGHVGFLMTYDVVDKEFMFAPDYLIWGLWIALGAQPAAQLLHEISRRRARIAGGTILVLLAASSLVVNYNLADIGDDWSARRRGEAILAQLPSHATFIGTWVDVPILQYLQIVEKQRLDIEAFNLFFVRNDRPAEIARERLRRGEAVYTTSAGAFTRRGFDAAYIADCDCYRLAPTPLPSETNGNLAGSPR